MSCKTSIGTPIRKIANPPCQPKFSHNIAVQGVIRVPQTAVATPKPPVTFVLSFSSGHSSGIYMELTEMTKPAPKPPISLMTIIP